MPSRRIRIVALAGSLAGLVACADTPEEVLLDPSDITPLPVLNQPVASGVPQWLVIPTYDGSGEANHPDIAYFPGGWHGWEYWMAFNPYPNGNDGFENPSIIVSHDGINWSVPDGVTNPLVPYPLTGKAHNSDQDLSYSSSSNSLVMIFREVRDGKNIIKRLISPDGVQWSTPTEIISAPSHQLVSPALVMRDGKQPVMWVVDAGTGCSSQTNRVMARRWLGTPDMAQAPESSPAWSKAIVTNLQQPGYIIWHIDVTYVASRKSFWAIYPARPAGSKECGTGNHLFMARSRDGVHWVTWEHPVLSNGVTPWATGTLYRSTMLFDDATQMFRIWLSAGTDRHFWSLGYVEVPLPMERQASIVASPPPTLRAYSRN